MLQHRRLLAALLALILLVLPVGQAFAGSQQDAIAQSNLFNNVVSPIANYNADQLGPYNSFFANHQEVIDPGNGLLTLSQTDLTLPGRNGLDLELARVFQSHDANVYRMGTRVESDVYSTWVPGYWQEYWDYSPGYENYWWDAYESSYWDDYVDYNEDSGIGGGEYTYRAWNPECNCFETLTEVVEDYYWEWWSYYDHFGYDVYEEYYEYEDPYYYTYYSWVPGYWEEYTDYYTVTDRFTDTHIDRRHGLGVGWQWAFPTLEILDGEITYHNGGSSLLVDWKSASHFQDYPLRDVTFDKDSGTFSNGQQSSKYVVTTKDGRKTYFASDGRLLGIVDRYGNRITFRHTTLNGQPVISDITDTVGRVVTFTYAADSVTVTAPDGRTWRYNLGATQANKQILSSVTDPVGRTTTYSYTADTATFNFLSKSNRNVTNYYANLRTITYPTGGQTAFEYLKTVDNLGSSGSRELFKLAARKDIVGGADVNRVTYTYSGEPGGYPTHKNPSKLPSDYRYSGTMARPDGSTETVTYDNRHLSVQRETSGTGVHRLVEELYDAKKTPTEVRTTQLGANGGAATTTAWSTFDEYNNLTQSTDAQGAVTTYTYDPKFHQPTAVDVQQNAVSGARTRTEFTVNATNGNVEAMRQLNTEGGQDRSIWTYYQYDSYGNQVEEKVKLADGTFNTTLYAYDPAYGSAYRTRVTETYTDAQGVERQAVTQYGYDLNTGAVTSFTDPMGATTTSTHDALGRVKTITLPAVNGTTVRKQLSYDDTNAISNATDENGLTTSYHYDPLGRLTSIGRGLNGAAVTLAHIVYDSAGNKSAETDAKGNTTRYTYDADGRLTTVTLPDGAVSRVAYDDLHRQQTETDPNGNVVITRMDVMGRPAEVSSTPDQGNTAVITRYTYDYAGNVLTAQDPLGNTTQFTYDLLNRMTRQTDLAGNSYTYVYDNAGNQISATGPGGRVTTSKYDRSNRLLQTTDPAGSISRIAYDAKGRKLTETDVQGGTTRYEYDALDRLVRVTDAMANTATFTFDGVGNRLTGTDARGKTTTYAYDEWYRLKLTTDPTGAATALDYDRNGNVTSRTDARGYTTRFVYDSRNRLVQEIDALGVTVATHTYDAVGNRLSTRDALGGITTFAYDGLNRLAQKVNPLGAAETLSYDAAGHLLRAVNAKGRATQFSYDSPGRLIGVQDATGAVWSYTYDAYGNVTRVTDPLGRAVREDAFDQLNRRTASRNGAGNVTSFLYDRIGNLAAAQTDNLIPLPDSLMNQDSNQDGLADGWNTVRWTNTDDTASVAHSVQGNAQSISVSNHQPGPDGAIFDYSAAVTRQGTTGRAPVQAGEFVTLSVDARQSGGAFTQVGVTYYDAQNKPLAYQLSPAFAKTPQWERHAFTPAAAPPGSVAMEFSLILRTDGSAAPESLNGSAWFRYVQVERGSVASTGPREFRYDGLNRRTEVGAAGGVDISYAYDAAGNRSQMVDAGGTTTYAYDAVNRITARRAPDGKSIGYAYDGVGNLQRLTDYAGNVADYTYSATGQLLTARFKGGAPASLSYNAAGKQTQLQLPNGITSNYAYDAAHRMTALTISKGAAVMDQFAYGYDAVNNLASKTENGRTTAYQYDSIDRLLQALSPGGTTTYGYDAVGNRIQHTDSTGATAYSYDAANRLTQVAGPAGTSMYTWDRSGNQLSDGRNEFAYDGLDHLVQVAKAESTVTYRYDGDGLMSRRQEGESVKQFYLNGQRVINEANGNGAVTSAIFDALGIVVGRQVGSDAPVYYLRNGHGDTVGLADNTGARIASYEYDAFGQLTSQTGSNDNPYLYAGEYYDSTTEQYYLRSRFYDPQAGRFLTQDSFLGRYNDPQSLHLYAYVKNNPLAYVDPSGHRPADAQTTKQYWVSIAKGQVQHMYGDPILRNREITAQYAKMYLNNPDLYKWAGAAAYVSKTVGDFMAFLDDISKGAKIAGQLGKLPGISQFTAHEAGALRDVLGEGNRRIYVDIYWQHLAYNSGDHGMEQLENAYKEGDLSLHLIESWRTIHEGNRLVKTGNPENIEAGRELIFQGAQGLAYHEQNVAIAPIYEDERFQPHWKLLSMGLYSPIPGNPNPMFRSHFPGGNIADVDSRWKWTRDSLLTTWRDRDTRLREEVIRDMTEFSQQTIAKPTVYPVWVGGHFELRSRPRLRFPWHW